MKTTLTPRTDAAWSAAFDGQQISAGRTARALREHSQQLETELTALTAERDHWQKIAVSASHEREHHANVAQALTAERDQLRAEMQRLRSDRDCEKRLRKDADEFRENAIERATKAEADLVALEQCHDDNCRGVVKIAAELAVERARLDWLESPAGMDWQWQAGITRATIDAKMKEGAK